MVAVDTDPLYQFEDAAVVVDEVSMIYRLQTSSSGDMNKARFIRRFRRTPPTMTTEVRALNPISLVVTHGESVGVIGRNGSGKSTLMKLVAGQQSPTKGVVYATSTPVMLGVNAALIPGLTGAENIMLGCLALGMTREQVQTRHASIVDLSGLENSIHRPLKTYSSGMASRLQFAIAASIDPEILILDEAMNTGDAEFADRTRARFKELLGEASTVFLVSHGMNTIKEMCSRVVWIDEGNLLADGEPEKVTTLYEKFIWHLKKGDKASAARVQRAALKGLHEVRIVERSTGRRRMGGQ